jgi:3-dehydroquinate dehydratase II
VLTSLRPDGARRWNIGVIDGPNMPNLGNRSKKIHGPIRSLDDLQALVRNTAEDLGVTVTQFTSNHEGEILEFIHRTAREVHAYIINPWGRAGSSA